MKFTFLFGKAPKHKRFEYKPRYYDEIEERIREREERIREGLKLAHDDSGNIRSVSNRASRIKGAIRSSSRGYAKKNHFKRFVATRIFLILILLTATFFAWFYLVDLLEAIGF